MEQDKYPHGEGSTATHTPVNAVTEGLSAELATIIDTRGSPGFSTKLLEALQWCQAGREFVVVNSGNGLDIERQGNYSGQ